MYIYMCVCIFMCIYNIYNLLCYVYYTHGGLAITTATASRAKDFCCCHNDNTKTKKTRDPHDEDFRSISLK